MHFANRIIPNASFNQQVRYLFRLQILDLLGGTLSGISVRRIESWEHQGTSFYP